MPRVSKAKSDENRATIEQVSSRLFRERGLDGVSVSDLMASAGLTHGGFYGHFESKDALASLACANAFADSLTLWRGRVKVQSSKEAALTAIVKGFLSKQNRDDPGLSCPAASLAVDVSRQKPAAPIRNTYAEGFKALVGVLEDLQETGHARADQQAALAAFSTMVGGLLLARALQGDALSDEILSACRSMLLTK